MTDELGDATTLVGADQLVQTGI